MKKEQIDKARGYKVHHNDAVGCSFFLLAESPFLCLPRGKEAIYAAIEAAFIHAFDGDRDVEKALAVAHAAGNYVVREVAGYLGVAFTRGLRMVVERQPSTSGGDIELAMPSVRTPLNYSQPHVVLVVKGGNVSEVLCDVAIVYTVLDADLAQTEDADPDRPRIPLNMVDPNVFSPRLMADAVMRECRIPGQPARVKRIVEAMDKAAEK